MATLTTSKDWLQTANSARAGVAGIVVDILGQNGELVEHGEVLLLVKPD